MSGMGIRRVLTVTGWTLGMAMGGFAVFVAARQKRTHVAPALSIAASSDPAVIERGKYLVRRVASCADCHADPGRADAVARGDETVPLSGGKRWQIPPGTFFAPNITSDPTTGAGAFTDVQIASALRHGIGHDGRALLPFMEMQGLADDDLVAVVSYLRLEPAVKNTVSSHEVNLLGKVVIATILAEPVGPKEPPPHLAPHGPTVENGRYLADSVANCFSCHTPRDMRTGKFTGPRYGGARRSEGGRWNPPNLTSDPKTGRTAYFSEDAFVARMRAGRTLPGSPMPWAQFAKLDVDDLRAVYRYLRTVPPVENDTGAPCTDSP
jgi:mono/diheme cytochrome c family protein